MKVAAVSTILNEEAICGQTIEHLLAHGVDQVFVAHGPSMDRTEEILAGFPEVVIVADNSPIHHQPAWIRRLGDLAHSQGHDWIVPFDADEFWCPVSAPTIRDALEAVQAPYTHVYARQYHYHTLEMRNAEPSWLPKIAYRWTPDIAIHNGNHGADGLSGESLGDVLVVRELQFMSLAHMRAKSSLRVATLDPSLPPDHGLHQRVLAAMNESDLACAWQTYEALASVHDPIEVKTR